MKPDWKQVQESELLVLPDGKILAHNITLELAAMLRALNPQDHSMDQRATGSNKINETAKRN